MHLGTCWKGVDFQPNNPEYLWNLTPYHTIPTFNDPEKESLFKTLWEKEKMLVTSIFYFSHNVFNPSLTEFQFLNYI